MLIGIDARALSREHPAGIGNYLIEVLSCMRGHLNGSSLILYSCRPFGAAAEPFAADAAICLKVVPAKNGTLWVRFSLPKVLTEDGVDIFWGPEHILPRRTAALQTVRFVLTIHDLALLIHPAWGRRYNALIQNLFVKRSAQEADRILAISQSTKKDIVRLLHIAPEKIQVTYLAGSEGNSAPAGKGGSLFLYVGTIEPRKNIGTIIAAFEKLLDETISENGTNCGNERSGDGSADGPLLVLAGAVGWRADGIVRRAKESPYADRIRLAGYVSEEEKEELYREAAAFVFPSHYEGFGIPVIEAMKRGVPVITARDSSLPEAGGDAALYIDDENDSSALADRMAEVLAMDGDERRAVVEAGFRQAARFSWEKCASETLAALTGDETEE